MATALTGAQRAHPADATAGRSAGYLTSLEAPLSPTAPIRLPPNQAAAPRSCIERMTVFRLLAMNVPLAGNDGRKMGVTCTHRWLRQLPDAHRHNPGRRTWP